MRACGPGAVAKNATRGRRSARPARARSSQRHDGHRLEPAHGREPARRRRHRDDEIRDEDAVGVRARARASWAPDDENAAVRGDRGDGGAAAVEDDEIWRQHLGQPGAVGDVRARDLAGQPSAAPTAPDRRTPVSAAVSRWSEAACRPARESFSRLSTSARPRSARARRGRRGPSRRRRAPGRARARARAAP